jgi:ABC-type transport system involved in cytochrome bd biosynthesis fused ATPase/permease subunit
VELCRALAYPSQLLLLDEPFTGLDKDSLGAAQQLVLQHQDGRTLIVASHDRNDRQAMGLERCLY